MDELFDAEIKELKNSIGELEAEIAYKKALYDRRNDFVEQYSRHTEYVPFRIGRYDYDLLSRLSDFERWKDSYYVTHQVQIESIITSTLCKMDVEGLLNAALVNPLTNALAVKKTIKCVCILDAGMPDGKGGYRFYISDPYGMEMVQTHDAKLAEILRGFIGRYIVVQIQYGRERKGVILAAEEFLPDDLENMAIG